MLESIFFWNRFNLNCQNIFQNLKNHEKVLYLKHLKKLVLPQKLGSYLIEQEMLVI